MSTDGCAEAGITANSFHWRGEALYPGKAAWTLEGEFIAKRRAA